MSEDVNAQSDFELMDKEDEEQILQELRGVPVEKFIYKNARGEWDLSYAGTKWVVRQMAERGEVIRIDGHPKTERCVIDPEYITCTVLGRRVKVNIDTKTETLLDTNFGAARGWIKQRLKDGTIKPDDFFYNKTTSKSARNLLQALIPPELKREMITKLVAMYGKPQGQQRPPQGQQQNRQQNAPDEQAPSRQQTQQSTSKTDQQKQPPQGGNAPHQGGSSAEAGEKSLEVVQQGFRAVFLQFAKTEDKPTLQKILKALTGKVAITDLERQVMMDLGPLLRKVINNELKWTGIAIQGKDGTQVYPKPGPKPQPQPEPAQDSGPVVEPMF